MKIYILIRPINIQYQFRTDGGTGVVVKLPGKSEIAGSSSALVFRFQRNNSFLPLVKIQYCEEPPGHDRKVACLASDRQGSNFEFCVWRAVLSHSPYHPHKVLQVQVGFMCTKVALNTSLFRQSCRASTKVA